jgi:hypothetical protein
MPGEIQGNSPGAFRPPLLSPTSFIMASDICTPYISDSTGHYECVPPPLGNAIAGNQLPAQVDGVIWQYSSSDELIGDVLDPPAMALSMFATGALSYRTTRIQVCPFIELTDMQGTWGSDTGAYIEVMGHSTCLPGKCILSTFSTKIELDTIFLELGDTPGRHYVYFRSNAKEVNFELTCKSLAVSYTIDVRGELDDPTPIEPAKPGIPPDDFNHWFEDLSIGGKVGVIIGFVVGGLALIGVLVALLIFAPEIRMGIKGLWNKFDEWKNPPKKIEDEVLINEDEVRLETLRKSMEKPAAPRYTASRPQLI